MTGLDESPTVQVFAALIAAILYAATYLSFVRLLRYPRNWHPPSLPASLATGLLAALTVALVALSPDGLDRPALALSAGFIVAMFCIVAAPSIAFRPASRPIEFLAKHGDHAGLWLFVPALAAGLAIPNIKLQAVLAVAMAIELTWFLRQRRAGQQHRLHPLNDHDLSVLKTQAEGDLEAFGRRHGIRELVLSEGAVSWKGCGKWTPPCPFNLYVNRLGLNTAPCCREHMKDLSHFVAACLSEMKVVYWLEGGSLLGAVREKGALLEWEDDIDMSVLLDDDMTWERLAAGLAERGARDGYFVDLFEKKGFVSISFDPPRRWPFRWERYRLRGEIRLDLAIYRHAVSHGEAVLERRSRKGAMPATESGGYGLPREIVLPTSTVPFLDGDFACPNQTEAYLRALYGDFNTVEYTYVDAGPAKARARIDDVVTARKVTAKRLKELERKNAGLARASGPKASVGRRVAPLHADALAPDAGRPGQRRPGPRRGPPQPLRPHAPAGARAGRRGGDVPREGQRGGARDPLQGHRPDDGQAASDRGRQSGRSGAPRSLSE